jgi:uncharacterized protein (TIGR03546 family)
MLTLLAKLFHALNSESSTRQLALAIALGFIAGLAPLFTLHNIAILFIVLLVRMNIGVFILALGFFKGLSYLLSPMIVNVGESLLTSEALQELWNVLYQLSLFKLAHFHHTYTLGALVLGIVLAVPLYFLSQILIEKYRFHIKNFIEKFKIIKALKASKFYQLYLRVSGQGDLT